MRSPTRLIGAFRADRRGAAAVEFAFVAGPFLMMLFAVIELALFFLLSTSLEAATDRASRRIRTGEFQSANETAAQFKTGVCGRMTWLAGDCETSLTVDVRVFESFDTINDPVLTASATKPGKKTFNPDAAAFEPKPAPSKIVVVRTYFKRPLIAPFYNGGLARMDNSSTDALVTSTQVFKTEPYQPT